MNMNFMNMNRDIASTRSLLSLQKVDLIRLMRQKNATNTSSDEQLTPAEKVWIGLYVLSIFRYSDADDKFISGNDFIAGGFNVTKDSLPPEALEALEICQWSYDPNKKLWRHKTKPSGGNSTSDRPTDQLFNCKLN